MSKTKYENRMVLTVPSRGVITIEGSREFVRKFFDDVKIEFINEMGYALQFDPAMKGKDFEIVETSTAKQTTLEVVEKVS